MFMMLGRDIPLHPCMFGEAGFHYGQFEFTVMYEATWLQSYFQRELDSTM